MSIVKGLLKTESRDEIPLQVDKIFDVITLEPEDRSPKLKYKYRVIKGHVPNSDHEFIVIDRDFDDVMIGQNSYCLKMSSFSSCLKMKHSEKWGHLIKGTPQYVAKLNFSVNAKKIDIQEAISNIFEEGQTWYDLVSFCFDDTKSKDQAMIDVFTSSYLFFIRPEFNVQRFNNHSVIATNPMTGKSETFAGVTGKQPFTDYTEIGLKGTIDKDGNTVPGILHGHGVVGMDEFTNLRADKDNNTAIADSVLTYMESGEIRRTLRGRELLTEGNKTLMMMGNCADQPSREDFFEAMSKVADPRKVSRVGRRIAHVIYGNDFKTVKLKSEAMSLAHEIAKKKARFLLEQSVKDTQNGIMKLVKQKIKWVLKKDDHYVKALKHMSSKYDPENGHYSRLVDGLIMGHHRLRFAAVKYVLLRNLDDVIFGRTKNFWLYFDYQLARVYERLKDHNFRSLRSISFRDPNLVKVEQFYEFEKLPQGAASCDSLSRREVAYLLDSTGLRDEHEVRKFWLKAVSNVKERLGL